MAVKEYALDKIDDNPYNPRKHYGQDKVKEMAQSLKEVGLRQVPEGRVSDERIQLAYGHMRLRGFRYNLAHKVTGNWGSIPVDVTNISDHDMFHFAMEENMRRTDITPLEVARCIEGFNQAFPDVLDEDIAKKHGMSAANVSNMKRVLRLPEKFLEKIDAGIITFTQGRELLTLEGIPDAEALMSSALAGINTTGNKSYSNPNTVEGLQKSIHSTINGHFPPLDKEWEGYRWEVLFDTRTAGCLKCDKCIITHPTKSQAAHYCTDEECWKQKTEEHKAKAAVAAKAKMEAEILERVAKEAAQRIPVPAPDISQEKSEPDIPQYFLEKRGLSWIALDAQGVVIAIDTDKKKADAATVAYFSPVAIKITPNTGDYVLNHTYRFMEKPGSRKLLYFDITAPDLPTAIKALGVDVENVEAVKVWKSSGKLGTGGSVSAGWSKCTEPLEDLSREEDVLEGEADDENRQMEEARERANLERPIGELPCENCANEPTCGRESFRVSGEGDDRYICDDWLPQVPEDLEQDLSRRIAAAPAPTPQGTPEDTLSLAREKAGTRAEVLDLNDICTGSQSWSRQMKQGFVLLSDEIRHIDEPDECLERCTHGFHYAFDSKSSKQEEIHVCSDTKCLAKKKGDLTRKRNAAGQARKNAEKLAIKQVLAEVDQIVEGSQGGYLTISRPVLELIIYNQLHGKQVSNYYYSGEKLKEPRKWLWDKLNAGTAQEKRNDQALWKMIRKLEDADLVKLVVEFMFSYLQDHGDTGSYEIKTVEPLGFFGVTVNGVGEKEPVATGVKQ